MRILLVEDDPGIGRAVVKGLEAEGFVLDWQRSGRGVIEALREGPSLVILDLMLPDIDGVLLARQIRLARFEAPILMLTARDGLEEKLEGFRSGADDYLTKPFWFAELLARVLALTRRGKLPAGHLMVDALVIDVRAREANVGGCVLELTKKEFEILEYLVRNPGCALGREAILENAWGADSEITLNAVDVYIGYLRKKLAAFPDAPAIKTVRGVGYKLCGPPFPVRQV